MKNVILTLFSLVLAAILKLILDLGLLKSVNPNNTYADCKYLKQDIAGPEDIVPYKNNSLITVSGNLVEIFYSDGPHLQHSTFYAIINAEKNNEVMKLEMVGFPNNIALYVHGIYIQEQPEGDLLYAINHAYNLGGERIEVFHILPNFTLVHNTSIVLGPDYFGRLNDLIVVSSSRILSTLWMPYPEPEIGRKGQTLVDKFWILLTWATRQKKTHVLDCHLSRQSKTTTPTCSILDVTASIVNNGMARLILGITWDKMDKVWVADSMGGIQEFQLSPSGLEFRRLLEVNDGIDNIEYEPLTSSLIIATLPKLYNHLHLDYYLSKGNKFNRQTEFEYWGGVVRYYLETNVQEVLIQGKYLSKGLSAAAVVGKYLYLGSFCDISVMVCRKI